MAKVSSLTPNRCECRKRGPISRNMSTPSSAPRKAKRSLTPYNCLDYKTLVLGPDNIRIIEREFNTKLDRRDSSGQNILALYERIKERIVDRRKEPQTTFIGSLIATWRPFNSNYATEFSESFSENLTAQEDALAIEKYLGQPSSYISARSIRQGKPKKPEQMLQDFLTNEVQIFQEFQLGSDDLQGLTNHQINNKIGPPKVLDNILANIKPDYLCGYQDPQTAFSIPLDIWHQIPEALRVISPGAKKTRDSLFLPFLALELKWKGVSERIVQQQLARCLSILAERQAELEKLSDSVSTTPIFGLAAVERSFTLWMMLRYIGDDKVVRYDMCELDSYDLTSGEDLEDFYAVMTNIHDWVENERKAHFKKCIGSISQNAFMRKLHRTAEAGLANLQLLFRASERH